MQSAFIDKLIERIDRLDPGSLQSQFLHLAGERGLMETIFHAIQEGIIVLNESSKIDYANRAAENLLGFQAESARGESISRYIRDIEWDRLIELDETEWSRLVSREIETTYPRHRFLTFYVVPLSVVNDKAKGAVVILRDITAEREHEAEAIESEKLQAITLLAAGVAHEIGNPLNSLTIHLQLIERELNRMCPDEQPNLKTLLQTARNEVSRLDQIINQFLKALRPVRPNLEISDMKELVQSSIDFIRHEIEDRGVWVELEAEADLPAIHVDPGQIRQAFYNIFRNAIQAMPEGGLLKVKLSHRERFVAVAVKDSGTGINAEQLSHIFEPYHTTKKEGSGLGLMIVQRIVRDHGGELEVDSEPSRGTTITLYFPVQEYRTRLLKAHRLATEAKQGQA